MGKSNLEESWKKIENCLVLKHKCSGKKSWKLQCRSHALGKRSISDFQNGESLSKMDVMIQPAIRLAEVNSQHAQNHGSFLYFTILGPVVLNYISVSETCLKQSEISSIPGYNFFTTTQQASNKGGGVAWFVKSGIPCTIRTDHSKSYSSELEVSLLNVEINWL